MEVPATVDGSKQVWERADCKVYEGQKAGKFIWDGSDTTGTVEAVVGGDAVLFKPLVAKTSVRSTTLWGALMWIQKRSVRRSMVL
ncbi:chitinase [Vibrio maritimus]|uniref:Chitinase n=1 Tax=Vibrio maritimus TaxID=990268 RepID=A0A090RQT8_9VIBR|nr:chitinase [Vibrio maritimus]